jgi:nitrite reductase/ring-hydroxylating ferredoxin subunit
MAAHLRHGQDQGVTGRVLCRLEDIGDGQGKGFTFGEDVARREIFVLRDGDRVHGYVNACPHQGTPLDWTPDRFISADTGLVLCSTHGAQFRQEDGFCVSGPCAGQSLEAIQVALDDQGRIVLIDV